MPLSAADAARPAASSDTPRELRSPVSMSRRSISVPRLSFAVSSSRSMKWISCLRKRDALKRLLFYGNVILPFVDRFPTDLELYRIMTTKLTEITGSREE